MDTKKSNYTEEKITRKEAIKKIGDYGKYAALTALGTYILLNPKQAQAQSIGDPGSNFKPKKKGKSKKKK